MAGGMDVWQPFGALPRTGASFGGGGSSTTGASYSQSANQATSQNASTSFIPDYSQTPILENIAQYAENMAPVVYDWGMQQYAQNQGNINTLLNMGQTWASPQRIASEMGMAEAGAAQAGEQARQSSIADLQSYGIDPSAGRYAALDQANRVQTAAAVAGAGNQQRMATQQTGMALLNQGIQASLANTQMGYGAGQGLTNLLGTGMQLKYSPLGTAAQGSSQSTGESTAGSWSGSPYGSGSGSGGGGAHTYQNFNRGITGNAGVAKGGYISPALSASHGAEVDDVPARLNAGEFVIPREVVQWKGKEFFSKLIAQVRKQRAMGGSPPQQQQAPTGYANGGFVGARRWQ